MKKIIVLALMCVLGATASAKLPVPVLTPEAKAKADEAAAKTAHTNRVAAFQLCKSMEATAAHYYKSAKSAGKETKPPTETPPCADPGAFVWPAPALGAAPVVAAAPAKPGAKPAQPVKK